MKFLKAGLIAIFLLCSTQVFADIQLGRDYEKLTPAQATHSGNKIEVLEFFFYGCSHCFHLHPELNMWEKKLPKDVSLQYVPVIFQDSWESMARTFYALESLGQLKRLHDELFKAWNIDNLDLRDKSKSVEFVVRRGIDRAQFVAAYDSFSIGSKVSRANQMVRDFKIRGTPTVIVDGQYVITGLTPAETIRVLNELIVKVRKEHGNRKN